MSCEDLPLGDILDCTQINNIGTIGRSMLDQALQSHDFGSICCHSLEVAFSCDYAFFIDPWIWQYMLSPLLPHEFYADVLNCSHLMFQSRSLILQSQDKKYRPVFFRKVSGGDANLKFILIKYLVLHVHLLISHHWDFVGRPREFITKCFQPAEPVKPCLQTGGYSGIVLDATLLVDLLFLTPLFGFHLVGCCLWGNNKGDAGKEYLYVMFSGSEHLELYSCLLFFSVFLAKQQSINLKWETKVTGKNNNIAGEC